MKSTSLYREWSGGSESSSDHDDGDLFTSSGYVSLKRVPQKMHQPSWSNHEKLQRTTTYDNAPKYFNPHQKKHKLQFKRRTKIATRGYISLFPKFDLLIWYFPTYILRGRHNKYKHYTLLTICILFVFWTIYCEIYTVILVWFKHNNNSNISRGIFYLILYLNPFIGSCLRFYFFYYKFDWNIWHKKKKKEHNEALSYILSQRKEYKTRLRKLLRVYSFILIFTILSKYIFIVYVWWQIVLTEIDTQENLNRISYILWISFIVIQASVFIITIIIPDLLMVIVARLYLTECYLYAKSFVNQIEKMNTNDDIIDANVCEKYVFMNKKIDTYCKLFYFWILNLLLQMIMACWHTVSLYMHPYDENGKGNGVEWIIYNSIEALIYLLMAMFVLWPAMLMTEKINTLKIGILNEKLNKILKTRLHFHNDLILNNLMNAIIQKEKDGDKNIEDNNDNKEDNDMDVLCKSIILHSKQECALEILNRLKYLMKKYSCCYRLIGIEIDRSSIRNFIIALIFTNILSFMWNSF